MKATSLRTSPDLVSDRTFKADADVDDGLELKKEVDNRRTRYWTRRG